MFRKRSYLKIPKSQPNKANHLYQAKVYIYIVYPSIVMMALTYGGEELIVAKVSGQPRMYQAQRRMTVGGLMLGQNRGRDYATLIVGR